MHTTTSFETALYWQAVVIAVAGGMAGVVVCGMILQVVEFLRRANWQVKAWTKLLLDFGLHATWFYLAVSYWNWELGRLTRLIHMKYEVPFPPAEFRVSANKIWLFAAMALVLIAIDCITLFAWRPARPKSSDLSAPTTGAL